MFSKADLQIVLDGPDIYRPNDLVKGVVIIKASKDFIIRSLSINFGGSIVTTFTEQIQETYYEYVDGIREMRTRVRTVIHEEDHNLFFKKVELVSPIEQESLIRGQEKIFSFELSFPEYVNCGTCGNTTTLPPSIRNISENNFSIRSSYHLNAFLEPDSTFGSTSANFYLKFKPQGNHNFALTNNGDRDSFKKLLEWKSKLKPLLDENYYIYNNSNESLKEKQKAQIGNFDDIQSEWKDKTQNEKQIEKNGEGNDIYSNHSKSISNPLHSSHRHTRFLRRLFSSHYKSENYKKLVGDVNLEVEFLTEGKAINSIDHIGSNFSLILRSRIEELKPNFLLYCNESSRLGSFVIVKFQIYIITKMHVSAQGHRGIITRRNEVFHSNYGYDLAFDIVDFSPNIDNPYIKEWRIPMDKLFNNNVINLVASEIGPTYTSNCNVLNISHSLCVSLSIAPNLDGKPKVANFTNDIYII